MLCDHTMGAYRPEDVLVLAGSVGLGLEPVGMVALRERRPADHNLGTKDSSGLVGSSTCQQEQHLERLGGRPVAGELRKHVV